MRNKNLIIVLTLLIAFCSRQALSAGRSGAQFLKIGVGARACAMGEAFVALSDDPSALYWNPSGMNQINRVQMLASQNFWLLDMSHQYVALVLPTTIGKFGISGSYSSSGKIPKYENFQQIGDYSAYDIVGTLGYSRNLRFLSLGATGKYIQQKIDNVVASSYALDAGLIFNFFNILNFGFVAQNFGPDIKFIEESDPLPFVLKYGFAFNYKNFVLASDYCIPKYSKKRINIGVELPIGKAIIIRSGYKFIESNSGKFSFKNENSSEENNISGGIGIKLNHFHVDYAYIINSEIEDIHQISINIEF